MHIFQVHEARCLACLLTFHLDARKSVLHFPKCKFINNDHRKVILWCCTFNKSNEIPSLSFARRKPSTHVHYLKVVFICLQEKDHSHFESCPSTCTGKSIAGVERCLFVIIVTLQINLWESGKWVVRRLGKYIFIRPSSDGTYYGMVMSVRPSVRPHIFCTFLIHALR